MSAFEQSPPCLTQTELSALLGRNWNLSGTIAPLASERDQNARIDAANGRFVLKVLNPAEDRGFADLQNAVIAHLAANDFAGVPRLIPTRSGSDMAETDTDGQRAAVRLVTFLDGPLLADTPKSPALLADLGGFIGRLSAALQGFGHPAAHRPDFLWNLDNALGVAGFAADIAAPTRRAMVDALFARYRQRVLPLLPRLRASVLHQDANDNNVIVDPHNPDKVAGLIDFGDMGFGRTINELAITLAYALMGSEDIYTAARALIGGYVEHFPLHSDEADVLYDLMRMRLAMSVCISSRQSQRHPDNSYLTISQAPAFALLERLDSLDPEFMAALFRQAAGHPAIATATEVRDWLASVPAAPLLANLQGACRMALPVDGRLPDMPAFSDTAFDTWFSARAGDARPFYGFGLYGEDRSVYRTAAFADRASPERRSRHMGIDIFAPAGTPVHAPLDGEVVSLANNDAPLDYGFTLILKHHTGSSVPFFTLYGHLSASLMSLLKLGQQVAAGDLVAHFGDRSENGGWAPHLHFQVMTSHLAQSGNFFGVGHPSLWESWTDICPDPNLLLRLAPETFHANPANDPDVLLAHRQRAIGPSLSVSYAQKLSIVRGQGAYLFDHTGRRYLDAVNNITHVGHCHPHVIEAMARQASILNTNSRYLNGLMLDLSDRLTATLPGKLSVAYFVNSGTEANELALRIARTATGKKSTIVLDWAYHGNSNGMVDISPYKFKRRGGYPQPGFVEIAAFPDPYRGPHKGTSANSGHAYADDVAQRLAAIAAKTGNGRASFIAESISGVGGQVLYPQGYLEAAYAHVRAEGGVCIADEVQCGFGRVGSHFWGFELGDVTPDIVVMGKPFGNGHPLAAVVTTPELAAAFANGMEYFNSFGGNPVSMAVGHAVLDVIETEGLQQSAKATGDYLLSAFAGLMVRYPFIGDVRGAGLFLGIELVRDRETLAPATEAASWIVNHMRQNGVLASTDGPLDNVLKFKPPMVFARAEADLLLQVLDAALTAVPASLITSLV